MRLFLLLCIIHLPIFISAQGKFEWFEDQCLKTGYFDTNQINYKQIQAIYYTFLVDYPQKVNYIANTPEEIKTLDLNPLQNEFEEQRIHLEKMKFPSSSFWETYRSDRLLWSYKELELKKQLIQAYSNPKVLHTKGACGQYVFPLLKGGKTLLNYWKTLVKEQQVNASDSSLLEHDFQQKWNSKKKHLWARIEVLNFGWWNCVNSYLNQHFKNENLWSEFEKLFYKISNSCNH